MPGNLCHRYGPGRLPYTDRRDVAAGVAMAATAVPATVAWFALLYAVQTLLPDVTAAAPRQLATLAGVAAIVVVPAAFVAGTLLWCRAVPEEPRPVVGAVAGAGTALLSLLPVPLLITLAFGAASLGSGTPVAETLETTTIVAGASFTFAYAFTVWVIVPVGAFGGWYHERAHACVRHAGEP